MSISFVFQVNYLTNEFTNEILEESAWCAVPWNEDSRTPLYLVSITTTNFSHKTCVNFINVLHEHFLYERLFGSYMQVEKAAEKHFRM